MRIENAFEVEASPEDAWALLMDVPRVIPCMPGAELRETLADDRWKATMAVRLGPIALTFDTEITRQSADEIARRAVLSVKGREARGRGSARATIESTISPQGGGARVDIATDLTLSGPLGQYGRGLVQSVAGQLTASFARCLRSRLTPASAGDSPEAAALTQPRPVSGIRLGFKALLDILHIRRRRADPQ